MMKQLADVLDGHHWDDLPALLHRDFRCRYAHTGESFDRDTWVRLNAEYPDSNTSYLRTASVRGIGLPAALMLRARARGAYSTSR